MKRLFVVFMVLSILGGCGFGQEALDGALLFREKLLQAEKCEFTCDISADYGDEIHTFTLVCATDRDGDVMFSVLEPKSISEISGRISALGGSLTFDDAVLGFPLLADNTLSPVSAPWILINSLRNGYMVSCGKEADGMRLRVNDSYEDDALVLDICFDAYMTPRYAEIFWSGRRILTVNIEKFEML